MTFITSTRRGYNEQDQQVAHGLFLILVCDPREGIVSRPKLRAVVRHVRMVQCGHWMMARVRIGHKWFTLSGDYGSDGLPMTLPRRNSQSPYNIEVSDDDAAFLYDQMVPLWDELAEALWTGGGHNSAGEEATMMRHWATREMKELRKPIHGPK